MQISERTIEADPLDEATHPGPGGPIGLGLGGAILASAVWIALALVTGLTFHLMPMSGGLAAAAAIAWRSAQRAPARQLLGVVAGGLVSALTALAFDALSYPLDEFWVTVATILAGVALGVGWLAVWPVSDPA